MDFPRKGAAARPVAAAFLLALAVAIAWAVAGAATAPAVHTVVIEGMRFIPETIEVERGDTVVWHNQDPFPHTATVAGGKGGPASPPIAAGGSWTFTARQPGRYPYVCTLHRTMTGTLVVK